MAENSNIQWTHHTVNLWWGCTNVHEGCNNCYAETLSRRYQNDVWGNDKPRKRIKSAFRDLAKYQYQAQKENKLVRVFVGSMMDIFEKSMPLEDGGETGELRMELFLQIKERFYPNLIFLFLTKRPSNILKMIPEIWVNEGIPNNVWFGTSPVNQATFNTLVPQLAKTEHHNLFLSVEPQLGHIDMSQIDSSYFMNLEWIIQGGESGHHRRPFDIDWAIQMRKQCEQRGITYFFKQIDKVIPIPDEHFWQEFPIFMKQ